MNKYNILFIIGLLFSGPVLANDFQPIENCQDLQDINSNANYVLVDDIDCGGFDFQPITHYFKGTLDGGNGHIIKHLRIEAKPGQNVGLFTNISGATITNIHFESSSLKGDINTFKGLIAAIAYRSTISDITVKYLNITPNDTHYNNDTTWHAPSSGGLVGSSQFMSYANINLDEISMQLKGSEYYAGGLIGEEMGSTISDVSITNLYIEATDPNAGESECADFDFLSCGAGGLIGGVWPGSQITIDKTSVEGRIEALYNAGGFIGWFEDYDGASPSYIRNSYTDVRVNSKKFAGGLIGHAPKKEPHPTLIYLDSVYAIGEVETSDFGQAFVGNSSDRVRLDNTKSTKSFFDIQTTGKNHSGVTNATGYNTDKMQEWYTFAVEGEWNANIWFMRDGFYPVLY
jgi:hypothetical protein